MVRMETLSQEEQQMLMRLPSPSFDTNPWAAAPALEKARLAIITTAGLHTRDMGRSSTEAGSHGTARRRPRESTLH